MNFFSKLFNLKQNNHNRDTNSDCNNFYLNDLECGLTPGQLILIDWTQKTGRNYNFPRYFKYSLQIDPESTHNQLYKLGYFTKNKTLSYLTVVELKTILSKHNLATSGKKAELITRIINNVNIDNLDIPFEFKLTKEAQNLIIEHSDYIKAYYDKDITMEDYCKEKNNISFKATLGDIKWSLLNKQAHRNTVSGDFGCLSNTRKAQGRHLEQEGNIKHALIYYIESLIITISGLENNFSATDYPVYYPDSIPDYSLKHIQTLMESLSDDDYDFAFDEALFRFSILNANHFLSKEDIDYLRVNLPRSTAEEINNYLKKYECYSPLNNLELDDFE
ncbi:TPA: SAP domain-containing protein [Streptococcus pneumoniae]